VSYLDKNNPHKTSIPHFKFLNFSFQIKATFVNLESSLCVLVDMDELGEDERPQLAEATRPLSSESPAPPSPPLAADKAPESRSPARPAPQMSPDDNHNHRSESSKNLLANGTRESNGHDEDEKIREYLGRSDTAVIFPEPVDTAAAAENGKSHFFQNLQPLLQCFCG